MTEALIVLAIVAVLADLYFALKAHSAERGIVEANGRLDKATVLFESTLSRLLDDMKSEAEAHRKETDKLLTRIQAPEAVAYHIPDGVNLGKQYISEDNDSEGWEAIKAQSG